MTRIPSQPTEAPGQLLGGLFFVEVDTNGFGCVGVDRAVAAFDVTNNAVLVDDDVGAQGPLIAFTLDVIGLQDAVRREHFVVHIAEEWKLDIDLLGESFVCRGAVHAYAENCRVVQIHLTRIDSRLDRLELLGSTTREG
jgi:hypothetical protein